MSVGKKIVFSGALAMALVPAVSTPAAALFTDKGESTANFTVVTTEADTTAGSIDYSTLGIPEAPGTLPGSMATTGLLLTANKGDATAAITGLNVVLGSTPVSFSGLHTLEFYVWMNVPTGATGSSEQFLAGTARSNTTNAIYGNFRSSRGNGAWFLLSGDNGLAIDYRHYNNNDTTGAKAYGDDNAAISTQLNDAFTNHLGGARDEAANEWVKVDLVNDPVAQTSSVYMNNILFTTHTSTSASGFAWIGYEDPATSIGTAGLGGIFDNIAVYEGNVVPEPMGLGVLALGGLAMVRRRRM
jgi:hypothetical protein